MAHPPFTLPNQFRLLDLYPGDVSDDLSSRIFLAGLDNPPVYDALSYAWDSPGPVSSHVMPVVESMSCNGQSVPISANLGRALQYLRDRHHTRSLWIDKLCINQSDVGEREQQIRHMGTIFSKAQDVVVWLGDSDENTKSVWEFLQNLRLLKQFKPPQMYYIAMGWKMESYQPISEVDVTYRRAFLPIPPELMRLPVDDHSSSGIMKAFFSRSWFSRLWTLQEVAVSRGCRVICGKFTMLWEDICLAAVVLQSTGYGYFLGPGSASLILRDGERMRWNSATRTPLRDLLALTRNLSFQTTHEHDKIFGLLSLIGETSASRLNVQYARPLSSLFSDVARACIAEDKSLAILGEVDLRPNGRNNLSSWVPDWRRPSPTSIALNAWLTGEQRFRCAGLTEPMIQSGHSSDELIVRGFLVAPISRILRIRRNLNLTDPSITQKNLDGIRWVPEIWTRLYRQAAIRSGIPISVVKHPEYEDELMPSRSERNGSPNLTPLEMLQKALRRTLTADLYPRPDGRIPNAIIPYHFPAYSAWQESGFDGPPPQQVLWEHDSWVKSTMFNRRAFVAGSGEDAYLGIGLKTLQQGDWIAVLLGGDTPFILRPTNHAKGDDMQSIVEWNLVSECYVHGLMDGEAMTRIQDPDFKYKDFVIPPAHTETAKL